MPAPPHSALITLTTDFGLRDPYVAAMKGVIRAICPYALIDDLSHTIPPQDLRAAALFLSAATPHYPAGAIHVTVVDPGVGSERLPLVLRCGGQYLVCPDNGIATLLLRKDPAHQARVIENPEFVRPLIHPTFHGRDVFAPCAAHLAAGRPFEAIGPLLPHPAQLDLPEAERETDGTIRGEIIYLDHFGNCITNIPADWLCERENVLIHCANLHIRAVRKTYAQAAPGEAIALISSFGTLEIAVREGNAATALGILPGTPVHVTRS